jgi:hypothetical protein
MKEYKVSLRYLDKAKELEPTKQLSVELTQFQNQVQTLLWQVSKDSHIPTRSVEIDEGDQMRAKEEEEVDPLQGSGVGERQGKEKRVYRRRKRQ